MGYRQWCANPYKPGGFEYDILEEFPSPLDSALDLINQVAPYLDVFVVPPDIDYVTYMEDGKCVREELDVYLLHRDGLFARLAVIGSIVFINEEVIYDADLGKLLVN